MTISPSTLGEKTAHSLILKPEELIEARKGTMLQFVVDPFLNEKP